MEYTKNQDYIIPFHEDLEKCITDIITILKSKNSKALNLGSCDLSRPILNYLWYKTLKLRDTYILNKSDYRIFSDLYSWANRVSLQTKNSKDCYHEISKPHKEWEEKLRSEKHKILFYASSTRILEYSLPLLCSLKNDLVILATEITENAEQILPKATFIKFTLTTKTLYCNNILEQNLPILYNFANTIGWFIEILEPQLLLCLDGCQTEYQLAATFCTNKGIPSICIQHGWPSFLHTGFRQMPYTYFFTWGYNFNALWEVYNPQIKFIETGYMYTPIENGKHNAITFFLQAPIFLSCPKYLDDMYSIISETALRYPQIKIMVREHPEYKVNQSLRDKWCQYPNISLVSNCSINEVYANTKIAVSHYSSTIIECLIHGCTPLVFDKTTNSRYSPDIEKNGLGLISTNEDSFFYKIDSIINGNFKPKNDLQDWFKNIGGNTLYDIREKINDILTRKAL